MAAYYQQLQQLFFLSYTQTALMQSAVAPPTSSTSTPKHLTPAAAMAASPTGPNYALQQQMFLTQLAATNPALLPHFLSLSSTPTANPTPPPLSLPTSTSPPTAPDDPDHLDFSRGVIRCVCGSFHREAQMLRCSGCAVLQHPTCIGGGGGEEYYCDLCEPTAPVHVGREMMVKRKETEWRELMRKRGEGGSPASAGSDGKRKRTHGGSGRKRRRGDAQVGGDEVEEEVLKQLTAMFCCEIDDGLFDSDADAEAVRGGGVGAEVKEQGAAAAAPQAVRNGWEREDARVEGDAEPADDSGDDDEGDDDDATSAPHHRRAMTESEKDAAAAISLLSPRPLGGGGAGRGRGAGADPLISLSPHRNASSPSSSSASFFSSLALTSSSPTPLTPGSSKARPLHSLLQSMSPSHSASHRRSSLSLPSSPSHRTHLRTSLPSFLSPRHGGGPFSVSLAKALGGVLSRSPRGGMVGSRASGEGVGSREGGREGGEEGRWGVRPRLH